MESLHCTGLQEKDIWRFAVSSKTNEVQDEYTVRSMRIPRWKKNLNWLAVGEAVKLIEGVHFHYQLRSAYVRKRTQISQTCTQVWPRFNLFAWRGRFCWHENWSRTELMSMSRVGICRLCPAAHWVWSWCQCSWWKRRDPWRQGEKVGDENSVPENALNIKSEKSEKDNGGWVQWYLLLRNQTFSLYSDLPNNGYVPLNF